MNEPVQTSVAARQKARVMLAGGWERMIENLMESLADRYQTKRGPGSAADFKKVMATFRPHAVVVCLEEGLGEILRVKPVLEEALRTSGLPVIVVGQSEDCEQFKCKVSIPNIDSCPRPLDMNEFQQLLERRCDQGRQLLDQKHKERKEKIRAAAAATGEAVAGASASSPSQENIKAAAAATRAVAAAATPDERRLMYEIEKMTLVHGRQTVLVVDDDVRLLNVIKLYLQDLYDVTVVPTGKLAIKFLAQKGADMVLLDYLMPEMDGPEVLRQIRSNTPEPKIPVVFLTGVAEKDLVIKGLELGPKGYLLKPVSRMALLEKVTQVLLGLH